jgi:hypothetical protein
VVVNFLDTQTALVEADEGIAIIPSFGLPACHNRKVVLSRLIDSVVNLEFHQMSNRGKQLPPGANEFTAFLQTYIARWAGRVLPSMLLQKLGVYSRKSSLYKAFLATVAKVPTFAAVRGQWCSETRFAQLLV